jgi:diguanylate cyclase (GGDEF)-like protein
VIEDLGSRNGTYINSQRVTSSQVLAEADRVGIGLLVEFRFSLIDEHEEGLLRSLYESSVLDALTGAFNRKHFIDRLTSEIAFARRHETPLSLIIFDLDHFKGVNDAHGHLGGDHVLSAVASLVEQSLRTEDVFARYGGEEFAIIARGIDVEHARALAERIRVIVAEARIEFNGAHVPVTISLGIASLACCTRALGNDALVGKADERLYRAKRSGRNRGVATD